MALLLQGGAIFLHIPKTGGNWVARVLDECGLIRGHLGQNKHVTMDRLLVPLSPKGNRPRGLFAMQRLRSQLSPKPFMFCFVRHPLAWYESWFKYMSQPARNWRDYGNEKDLFDWHPNAVLNGCGNRDFNRFVRNVITKRPGYVTELYASYAQPQIDFVGQQENLREDLIAVLKKLELKFDETFVREFEALGVSPKPKEKIEWDPDLRREVLEVERIALIRYGYEGNGTAESG